MGKGYSIASVKHSGGGYGGRLGKGADVSLATEKPSRKAPHILMYRKTLDANIDESVNALRPRAEIQRGLLRGHSQDGGLVLAIEKRIRAPLNNNVLHYSPTPHIITASLEMFFRRGASNPFDTVRLHQPYLARFIQYFASK